MAVDSNDLSRFSGLAAGLIWTRLASTHSSTRPTVLACPWNLHPVSIGVLFIDTARPEARPASFYMEVSGTFQDGRRGRGHSCHYDTDFEIHTTLVSRRTHEVTRPAQTQAPGIKD